MPDDVEDVLVPLFGYSHVGRKQVDTLARVCLDVISDHRECPAALVGVI